MTFEAMNSKTRFKRFLLVTILIYVAGGLALYFTQELFLFHPKPVPLSYKYEFADHFEESNISFRGNNLNFVRFLTKNKPKGIVLFFHGNMGNVEHYKRYPRLFTENDHEVWMIDYPGFGKTTGKKTEEVMYQQALYLYGKAVKRVAADSIIIYGKSIGTGIASYLAAKKPCKMLVLETPYYNIVSLARSYFPVYPVSLLLKYAFPNNKHLKSIRVPVTIFHGTEDEIIPYRHAIKLKKENPKVNLVTIENGKHNDLFEQPVYKEKMKQLLE